MKLKLALAMASTVVTLLLVEFILLFVPQFAPAPRAFPGERQNRPNPHFVADSVIGWRMRPNHDFTDSNSEFAVTYRSNAGGFRSDRDFRSDSALPAIILAGDSFTFGHGVAVDETFGGILAARLPNFEVENLGMTGFGLDQMWQTVQTIGLARKPALVVVGFVLDDLGRSLTAFRTDMGFNKPLFKVVDGRLTVASSSDAPGPLVRFLEERSRLWAALTRGSRLLARRYAMGQWWRLNDAIFRGIEDDCAYAGVPVLFVSIPSRQQSVMPALTRAFEDRGTNYLDLAGEKYPHDGPVAFPVDGHMNARGHRFVATQILAWIRAHPSGIAIR